MESLAVPADFSASLLALRIDSHGATWPSEMGRLLGVCRTPHPSDLKGGPVTSVVGPVTSVGGAVTSVGGAGHISHIADWSDSSPAAASQERRLKHTAAPHSAVHTGRWSAVRLLRTLTLAELIAYRVLPSTSQK